MISTSPSVATLLNCNLARLKLAGRSELLNSNLKRLHAARDKPPMDHNLLPNHIPRIDRLSAFIQPPRLLRSIVRRGPRAHANVQLGVVDTRDHAVIYAGTTRLRARCDRKRKRDEGDNEPGEYLTAISEQ